MSVNAIRRNISLAFRHLLRNKGVSIINISGLALGMTAIMIIFLYVFFEKSFDRFFDNNDRLYRLVFYRYYNTGLDKSVGNNYYVGQIASERIPEIENFCRCKKETVYIESGENIYKEERTIFADSSFFRMFSHKTVSGDRASFLDRPGMVVITESAARKYFGDENPLGKTIYAVNPGKRPLTVQGVIKDVNENSHLHFDLAVSLSSVTDKSYCYTCNNTNTYFLLRRDADLTKVASEITSMAKEYFTTAGVEITFPIEYHLQKVTDIHLHSNYRFEFETNGNSSYLSVLLAVAFLILISAGLNYTNLSLSITARKVTSVGIRIVNGATRKDILWEFITESLLTGFISMVTAFLLVLLIFNPVRNYLGLSATLFPDAGVRPWIIPVLLFMLLSVVIGIFPGLRFFRASPASFLRKEPLVSDRSRSKRLLLAIQIFISVLLAGFSIGAMKQIRYMQGSAMTMNIDSVLVVRRPAAREFNTVQPSFQQSLLSYPGIGDITFSTVIPGEKNGWVKGGISLKGKERSDYQFFQSDVAFNFFRFFDIRLIGGRQFFSDENNWLGGPRHLILNRQAAIALGEESFDKLLGQSLFDSDNKQDMGEIVGIVDGYLQNSPDQEIKPTIFNCDQVGYYIFIRIRNGNTADIVNKVTDEFRKYFKGQYFEYFFLDDFFNLQYRSHVQLFRCLLLFSIMALIITCLSLNGLAMMATVSRTKEIGIRKLNGASVLRILYLLNRDFILVTALSFAIAVPATWWALHLWLRNFASRTGLSWWIFALAGMIAFGIAVATVTWTSYRASVRNPVEALRYE